MGKDKGKDKKRRRRRRSSSSSSSTVDSREKRRVKRRRQRKEALSLWGTTTDPLSLGFQTQAEQPAPQQLSMDHRVYVGNIAYEATYNDVVRAFSRFGTVVNCNLQNDSIAGHHKGFCFIDYETVDAAKAALAARDMGISFNNRPCKIGPATTPPPQGAVTATRAQIMRLQQQEQQQRQQQRYMAMQAARSAGEAADNGSLNVNTQSLLSGESMPFVHGSARSELTRRLAQKELTGGTAALEVPVPPEAPKAKKPTKVVSYDNPLMAGDAAARTAEHGGGDDTAPRPEASNVVCLANLVGRVEEADDELARDVKQECMKFGSVSNLLIYDERQQDGSVHVKIFVQFSTRDAASKTASIMDGRRFDARRVHASLYPEDMFARILAQ